MCIESELTIRENCDSIRQQVDIAREIALENIHKVSNALMVEVDAYERECLSNWTAAKESTENVVEDVSKRMRAFLAEQHAFLQSAKARDDELTLRLGEANKLAQELSDRKKELKAAMFNDKIASFIALPSIGEASFGELSFTGITLPFNKLDLSTNELKAADIRIDYDFLLPLDHCQFIVTFKHWLTPKRFGEPMLAKFTQMCSFDRAGRLIGSESVERLVKRESVAQCGTNNFVVCHDSQLIVYDSALICLRKVGCKEFSNICCNSKFVFGLWDTDDGKDYFYYERDSDDYDDDGDDENDAAADDDDDQDDQDDQDGDGSDVQKEEYSSHRIQVYHLDTLSKAFRLRLPKEYTIERRIMADEHHLVAISESCEWLMSIFDLRAISKKKGNKSALFFRAEKHIELSIEPLLLSSVFLFDGWMVVPLKNRNELVWFDKNGKRSETRTSLNNISKLTVIYSSNSSLLFAPGNYKLLL